jgi:hypothetical protein
LDFGELTELYIFSPGSKYEGYGKTQCARGVGARVRGSVPSALRPEHVFCRHRPLLDEDDPAWICHTDRLYIYCSWAR